MALSPILAFEDLALTFGGTPLFEGIFGQINAGERIALVGRNGEGKSTLLKVIAGLVEPDAGRLTLRSGASVAYLEQDPDMSGYATLGDFANSRLPEGEGWRADALADGLKIDLSLDSAKASGGEKRRAALAAALAQDVDCLLLDEPTNHLDIDTILWLEAELAETKRAFILISHDRSFLTALTRRTFWIDRGALRILERGFGRFEDWRDEQFEIEDRDRAKLDKFIKAETRWAAEGISARRKRNMGRVRRLHDARSERGAARLRSGAATGVVFDTSEASGKKAIELKGVNKAFGARQIVRDLSLTIQRGDRIAIVGPNGVGKTTLVNLLTGTEDADGGIIKRGTRLEVAVFDQARDTIDPEASLWTALTEDRELGGSGKNDQVMVRGTPRHVMSYLKDFLFDEAQARGPVSALSGGERARLHLARIMARASNLLVLDEPTNDLDVETLDVLQEALDGYDGTVILVSHDRDFVDRVATQTLAMEGDGRVVHHAGGFSDYLARRPKPEAIAPVKKPGKPAKQEPKQAGAASGLNFTEAHRLEALPDEIAQLEAEIEKLSGLLSDATLFETNPAKFDKATKALAQRQAKLAAAEEEWLALAEKAEAS